MRMHAAYMLHTTRQFSQITHSAGEGGGNFSLFITLGYVFLVIYICVRLQTMLARWYAKPGTLVAPCTQCTIWNGLDLQWSASRGGTLVGASWTDSTPVDFANPIAPGFKVKKNVFKKSKAQKILNIHATHFLTERH